VNNDLSTKKYKVVNTSSDGDALSKNRLGGYREKNNGDLERWILSTQKAVEGLARTWGLHEVGESTNQSTNKQWGIKKHSGAHGPSRQGRKKGNARGRAETMEEILTRNDESHETKNDKVAVEKRGKGIIKSLRESAKSDWVTAITKKTVIQGVLTRDLATKKITDLKKNKSKLIS